MVAFIAFSSQTLSGTNKGFMRHCPPVTGLEKRMQWHLFPSPSGSINLLAKAKGLQSCCPQPPPPAHEALEVVGHR